MTGEPGRTHSFCYFVERLGPYHIARLNVAAKENTIIAVELSPEAKTYSWVSSKVKAQFQVVRLARFHRRDLDVLLAQLRPAIVFLNGWSDQGALWGLAWCIRKGVPAVLMSDSQEHDEPRTLLKESIKSFLVRNAAAAFVAGQRHVHYVCRLGMNKRKIVTGYDVVDNDYFERGADNARRSREQWCQRFGIPNRNFFLSVARLLPQKNLSSVIRAFKNYRDQKPTTGSSVRYDLVIAGDGELKPAIERQLSALNLRDCVHLIGFRQYDELPGCYGLANAFVLGSTTEQWGLVVNEAMASGLPVLVSNICGCVPELVHDGVNGFRFDPNDENFLAGLMLKMSTADAATLRRWGEASRRIVGAWSLTRFAKSMDQAASLAAANGPKPSRMNSFIINTIARFR